ncbi:hypothetical protein B0H14DRAFT_3426651 [Mycena olivaceomarginata]|nr:hypothetical protein B0H14DRAFT_3426651 [Mycena olivaceomarginata]
MLEPTSLTTPVPAALNFAFDPNAPDYISASSSPIDYSETTEAFEWLYVAPSFPSTAHTPSSSFQSMPVSCECFPAFDSTSAFPYSSQLTSHSPALSLASSHSPPWRWPEDLSMGIPTSTAFLSGSPVCFRAAPQESFPSYNADSFAHAGGMDMSSRWMTELGLDMSYATGLMDAMPQYDLGLGLGLGLGPESRSLIDYLPQPGASM